jgi:hypothetical protein
METVAIVTFVFKGDVLKQINPCHALEGSLDILTKFNISTRVLVHVNSLLFNTKTSVPSLPHTRFEQNSERKSRCFTGNQPCVQDEMTSAMYVILFYGERF